MAVDQFSEATAVYDELLKALPANPGIRLNLGMAPHRAGEDSKAKPHLEKVLQHQPDLFPAAILLANAHMRLNRPAVAVTPLRRALGLATSIEK